MNRQGDGKQVLVAARPEAGDRGSGQASRDAIFASTKKLDSTRDGAHRFPASFADAVDTSHRSIPSETD